MAMPPAPKIGQEVCKAFACRSVVSVDSALSLPSTTVLKNPFCEHCIAALPCMHDTLRLHCRFWLSTRLSAARLTLETSEIDDATEPTE